MIIILRSQIQLQTVHNLIAANVLIQAEAESYNEVLSTLSVGDLLLTLLESNQLRQACPNPIDYYPIGEICKN